MQDFLFYFFAALVLISGFMVVVSRNAVNSAMYMILSFTGTAGIYVLLNAYFIAIIQVLVYAGAVMVLFLFIVMLLNVPKTSAKTINKPSLIAGVIAFALLLGSVSYLFLTQDGLLASELPAITDAFDSANPNAISTTAKSYGYLLFTKYMLPFQVAGFLLLVSMVGVIVISKRLKNDENPQES